MSSRLEQLREEMARQGLDGYIVPMADRFQSEFVPEHDRRLEWLTGFSGSAGSALILKDKAIFFTDGRYTLQAGTQVDSAHYEIVDSTECSLDQWIVEHISDDIVIGYDAWLHTARAIEKLNHDVEKVGGSLKASDNLIDMVWDDKPIENVSPAFILGEEYTGKGGEEKRQDIAMLLAKETADALLVCLPESVCWLLNIRGYDLPCTPFLLSYAMVYNNGDVDVFTQCDKCTDDLRKKLGDNVRFHELNAIDGVVSRLQKKTVWVDAGATPSAILDIFEKQKVTLLQKKDPIILLKGCKNSVEVQGMKNAHIRDGAAVCEFLYQLDQRMSAGASVDECDVAEMLIACRKEQPLYHSTSFDTIAGYAGNGAIVHYRAEPDTCKILERKGLLLIDSGGQYLDGTTDITRTIALGELTATEKLHYTLVLKGHIALATAVFPQGTNGRALDILARQFLWKYGLDYNHGTGHGVGAFMNVHEGPQGISKRGTEVALQKGMVLSNEPGCYIQDAHGIRIENLVVVADSPSPSPLGKDFLHMETITLAPIDLSPVLWEILSEHEIDWLVRYHARIKERVFPLLKSTTKEWLITKYYKRLEAY